MPTLGTTIAQARKAKWLTQKELAERITKEEGGSISAQYLNDIEHDKRSPSEFVIGKLAAELNLDKDSLCFLAGILPTDMVEKSSQMDPADLQNRLQVFRKRSKRR